MNVKLTYKGRSELAIFDKSGVRMISLRVNKEDAIVFNGSDSILIGEHCVTINPDSPRKLCFVRIDAQAEFRSSGLVLKGSNYFALYGSYNGDITVSDYANLEIHGSCNGAIRTEDHGGWKLIKGSVTNELTNSTILTMEMDI